MKVPEPTPLREPDQGAVDELVELLDLETIDQDLYRGSNVYTPRGRVFGGQVAAQALCAGIRTVPEEFGVHSLHSYFLLPGDPSIPIVYDVERIRDGRSFLTRRVAARQHGRAIYFLTANFQREEEGFSHQDAMPDVIPPAEGLDLVELMSVRGNSDAEALGREWAALAVRWVGNSKHGLEPDGLAGPHHLVPPPLPRRPLVALRPVVAVGAVGSRSGDRAGLHRGRDAGRHGGPGGPDQATRIAQQACNS